MGFDFQAVVIGGGPSGARVAERLALDNKSVLLLEAEDESVDNLCSGLLNSEGQAALGRQLPTAVRRAPFAPLLEFHDADNRLRYRYDPRYWNMDRRSFDAWLRQCAAEAGAQVEYRRRVARIEQLDRGAAVTAGAGEIRAAVVIDATGWRALSRRGTASAPHVHAFQGLVHTADLPETSMWAVFHTAATPYYGWLVPKGGGTFLLGAGFPQGAYQTRREVESESDPWAKLEYFRAYIEHSGCRFELLDAKPLGCPITTIRSTAQLWWGAGGIVPVGEAAGLVSPSSGDGIHFGLDHANALAAELLSGGYLTSGLNSTDHAELTARVRRRLRPALAELRFNCLKARVGSSPTLRGVASRALPLYLRRPVERLRNVPAQAAE